MGPFIGENFMLTTDAAVELYHRYAAKMPIIDYHCHLDPKMIARNQPTFLTPMLVAFFIEYFA